MVEVTEKQIEKTINSLAGIKNGAQRALINAINRAIITANSTAKKAIRKTYRIQNKTLSQNGNIKLKRASANDPVGAVYYAGTMIPLMRFSVTPSTPMQRQVSAAVKVSQTGKTLRHAYIANLGKYAQGVFERETKKRESSKELYGPSPAHMLAQVDVLDMVEKAPQETLNKRLDHEIERLLGGHGT